MLYRTSTFRTLIALTTLCGTTGAQEPAPPPEQALATAQQAIHSRQYADAIRSANSVLAENDTSDAALYIRGLARIELGRETGDPKLVRAGILDARLAIKHHGRDQVAYYLPYLQGMTALSHLEQTPDHANTAAQVASNLLNKTTQARLRGQLLYQRAAAYAAVGENDAAETDLRNALRGDPQPLAPRLLLADLLFRDGRRDQAAEHYDKAAADFPDDPLVFNNRGRFRMRIKEPELAVVDFSTSLRLNPQFATAYRNRALALLATGDPAAAEQDLTMAIQLSPRDPVLRRLRASCRLLELRPQDAVEDLQRSVDLRPDPRSLADLAMAHTMNRDPEAALQTFRQLRQSHPELRYLRPWHCAALLAAHRPDEASQTFAPELARVETAPDTCFWSDWLVGTLIGPISEATLIQQAARRPGTGRKTEAYYFLGEKAELSDDPETAREYYRKAVRLGRQDLAAYRAARIAIAVPSPSTIAPASNSQASP